MQFELLDLKYIFAGKTNIKSKIIPLAAYFLNFVNNPKPKKISNAPERYTNSRCQLKYGGIILRKKSGLVKCLKPIHT